MPRIRDVLGTDVAVGYGLTEMFQFALARGTRSGRAARRVRQPLPGVQVAHRRRGRRPVGADEIGTLQLRMRRRCSPATGAAAATGEVSSSRRRLVHDARSLHGRPRAAVPPLRPRRRSVQGRRQVGVAGRGRARAVAHEAVWECAVIGADDDDGLDQAARVRRARTSATRRRRSSRPSCSEYVKNVLAPYKYPRWIEFVDAAAARPRRQAAPLQAAPGAAPPRRAETASRADGLKRCRRRERVERSQRGVAAAVAALLQRRPAVGAVRRRSAARRRRCPRRGARLARARPRRARALLAGRVAELRAGADGLRGVHRSWIEAGVDDGPAARGDSPSRRRRRRCGCGSSAASTAGMPPLPPERSPTTR